MLPVNAVTTSGGASIVSPSNSSLRGGTKSESHGQNDKHSDSNIDNDGTFSCDGCGDMISNKKGQRWVTCTECVDTDFCYKCFKKGTHSHHKYQIHWFENPGDGEIPYCDSCGYVFENDSHDRVLWCCSACEDYCVCSYCHDIGMHKKHEINMNVISVQEYLDEIG